MILGFDIDEVMVDIVSDMLKFMLDEYEVTRNISVFEKYGLDECRYVFDDKMNIEIREQLYKLVRTNSFLSELKPVYGAIESIKVLKSEGHEIHFITARPDKNIETTYDWFANHDIPYDRIVHSKGRFKWEAANNLKLDMFVDDRHSCIDSMVYSTKNNIKLLLLDKPWNLCYTNRKVKRVLNWHEIMREINDYSRTSKK